MKSSSSFALSETTDSIADTLIPCLNTSYCRSMPTLPRDTFCKDGFCFCPNVDTDVQACSSINASMHEQKISGDRMGNFIRIKVFVLFIDFSENDYVFKIIFFLVPVIHRVCKHDRECNFVGGMCNTTTSQCGCLKHYMPSSNKKHCVKSKRREIQKFFYKDCMKVKSGSDLRNFSSLNKI